MSIKEIWNYLLNKKWDSNELLRLTLYVIIASMLTTPLLGIPIGVIVYLYLSDDEFE
ncbi:VraH family protein [Staphylococcus pettenkoferi]|uniref:VraH family peptide resistance protein n=1 Tax=Staphylococcus pettenkoferi TaxID=170573 RepID=UPI0011A95E3A|nr:VraH family protein [Staphylococcus pettenkoferi]MCY1591002.1 VraH family protein [Staphylococcus pettenkoferi]MCY1597264.1 VraH family protein [Staphylococcus pettenkoferi]MCY1600478.1 VraH family protein [Staphylococcus pettenkoferi]MCY1601135.1 VraH family protein [Staphylococcus pettenkoferi]MCY1608876.1 VraH family protein [Staphylococcus pettenkoferi]